MDANTTAAEEGKGGRDGGGGVVARYGDNGRDVGQGDDDATERDEEGTTDAAEEGCSGSDGGGGDVARLGDDGDAAEEGSSGSDGGGGVVARLGDDGRDVGRGGEDKTTQDDDKNTDAAAEGSSGCANNNGRRGGRERGRARVRPDPGGPTSPGGLWGLGSWEPGHAPGQWYSGGRAVAGVVA